MSTPTLQPEVRADVTTTNPPPRPPSPRRRGRPNRLPYALIAPALVVMVLIHVLPAIGGLVLSFKKFNIFTFRELFGAPWNGLENYRSILLDTDNPLHSGFWGAVVNTVQYTFWTVSGTLVLGLAVALLLNRQMPGQRVARTRYRPDRWRLPEVLVAGSGVLTGGFGWWVSHHEITIAYPAPSEWPQVSAAVLAGALLALGGALCSPTPPVTEVLA